MSLIEEAKKQRARLRSVHRAALLPAGDTDSDRITIRTTERLDLMIERVVSVLGGERAATFQRSRQLVRLVRETLRLRGATNKPIALHISPFVFPTLRECLARHVRFVRARRAKDGTLSDYEVEAPKSVVAALIAREEYPGVRVLTGVIEAPALRPDGTIIQGDPGYDASTGLYFSPSTTFPTIAAMPTHADAQRASRELLEVVADFPFASEAHRSAWLAAVLTGFARPAIEGCCPFVAIDATTPGTGKTLLASLLVHIVLGRDAAKYSQPETDDEMRKRITSTVASGESMVVIDNIARPMAYPSLDGLLTSVEWADRELGSNTIVRGEARAIWVGTGNNLAIGGDLARRTLHVRLESQLENPEDRDDFTHPDVMAWVAAHRPRLVAAALTMLRAYFVAGCPTSGVKRWGSFEQWSSLVAGCVAWVGLPDPTQTRVELEASSDEGKAVLVAILDLWQRMGSKDGITVGAVLKNLYGAAHVFERATEPDWYAEARETIESVAAAPNGKPSPRKLAWFLKKSRRRVIGGRWLDEAGISHSAVTWAVRQGGVS